MLLEPSPVTFWFVLFSMIAATFVVVPLAVIGFKRSVAKHVHPGHAPMKKVLIFEGIVFFLCFMFYVISASASFANY